MGESNADDSARDGGGLIAAIVCALEAKNRFRTRRYVRRKC